MNKLTTLAIAATVPMMMGAKGDGCASSSRSPAPDVSGNWDINYDDSFSIEIKIGGSTYTETTGANGGVVTINHEGNPITFDLNCSRPDILCPSEAWPETVGVSQDNEQFEHRMIVTLPVQQCSGTLNQPDPSECGAGTLNEECDEVCDGELSVVERDVFGVIGEEGDSFRLYLGGGIATNGVNCVVLAASLADADLSTSGSADSEDWVAQSMDNGEVSVIYSGGCAWAGDTNDDGTIEALALGAKVTIKTGFTGTRANQ